MSRAFSRNLPGAGEWRRVAVLPVGIALDRLRPIPRAEARAHLGLDPDGPYLLFPHDPARPLKRFDRAREAAGDVPLLTMGRVAPDEVPYWINAANAVLVPSQDEGFGLAVLEALACGVPAFGTPVGIHPRRAVRRRGRVLRAVGPRRAGARRCARTSRRRTRGSTGAPARSCSRPTAWRRAWWRRGARWRRPAARPGDGDRRRPAYTRPSGGARDRTAGLP